MKKMIVLILLAFAFILSACTYSVSCDSLDLVDKITKANQNPGSDILELAQGCTYELSWIEDMTNGNNGLPTILSEITINGNGATIQRAENADHFRIFQVGKKANLTLNDLTIQNGYADGSEDNYYVDLGGAILNFGFLNVNSVLITDNYARYVGGVYNAEGTVDIVNSTISYNNADNLTNGILNAGKGLMEIYQSTISNNGLITYGDAIWNNGTLRVYNSTISDNAGVGIENDKDASGPGKVSLVYVTFSGNAAALNSVTETITILNTLFGPHQNAACSSSTSVFGLGTNMDTDGSCNITTVSPNSLKLGPLAGNGGPTQTHELGQGSVAIDAAAGECPVNDQRGIHRPQNAACDVGAFENDDPIVKQVPTQEICKFTALVNLFCRLGPGKPLYPDVDSFTPGQYSQVLGISPDGNFVQVVGATNQLPCYVAVEKKFGTITGYCDDLPVLEPPPTPIPDEPL
ncbi:MAG: hypothetical protein MUO54_05055, partial [Anaerolineales bacterium]|nr:hypothetical protein [Anaerolineales bacterium]